MLIYISVPIGSIQGILRHENRTTTEIYLHSIGEAEKFAMDVLDNEFENQFSEKSPTLIPTPTKTGQSKITVTY